MFCTRYHMAYINEGYVNMHKRVSAHMLAHKQVFNSRKKQIQVTQITKLRVLFSILVSQRIHVCCVPIRKYVCYIGRLM